MKYSKFFGRLNKDEELKRLSTSQIARLMNIVSLEGTIHGLSKYGGDNPQVNKAKLVFGFELTDLTGNLEPLKLFQEMVRLSE